MAVSASSRKYREWLQWAISGRLGVVLESPALGPLPAIRGPQADGWTIHCASISTIHAGTHLTREKRRTDTTRAKNYLMGRRQPIDFLYLRKNTKTACQSSNKLQSVILQWLGTSTIK